MDSFYQQSLSKSLAIKPDAVAVITKSARFTYAELDALCRSFAKGLANANLKGGDRIGIYLPKQIETVVAIMGSNLFGGVFVVINPALKAEQVDYIVKHCDIQCLISHRQRIDSLMPETKSGLKCLVSVDGGEGTAWEQFIASKNPINSALVKNRYESTPTLQSAPTELASIIYTSGSTGQPKGVMISNENLRVGAQSVAEYLSLNASDKLLAVLPFSFDYGLNQLTSALYVGASVTLLDYLLPKDIIKWCEKEAITGLAAVPPLWLKLSRMTWPDPVKKRLRYITSSGGVMPEAVVQELTEQLPKTEIFLMYGLTEAFRSTYLAPHKVAEKPGSIGQAIPEAKIFIVDENGNPRGPMEQGELIHLGPHVSMGYWNDPEKTDKRFRYLEQFGEIAVFSGDNAYCDKDGDIFFVSRDDEMIKSSGYRISPHEIESVLSTCKGVDEVVACGVFDEDMGQAIGVAVSAQRELDLGVLKAFAKKRLPIFQQPKHFFIWQELPKNANGKLDRSQIIFQIKQKAQGSHNDQ